MSINLDERDRYDHTNDFLSGVSFVSLVAPTEEKYYETIEFYTHLGFQENYDFDRSRREKLPELDICVSSEKEKWLFSEGSSDDGAGSNITLKIRYVSDAVYWKDTRGDRRSSITMLHGQILEQGKDSAKQDWRGSQEATIFYTEKLHSIRSVLEARGIQLQFHPDNTNPCEIYAFDPLGTLVGFTSKRNPFSKRVTQEQLPSAHITRDPSRVPTPQPGERRKKIAVLTSGGDAPGMNAAVRAVVRKSISSGCDAYIVREGYEGLVQGGNFIQEMGWEDVRGWLSEGGTLIGTARCMSFRERSGRLKAAKNLIAKGIDALIVCGGDGSLTGADLFRREWPSLLDELLKTGQISQVQHETHNTLNICGLVGSIDNDMSLTDATIGCYSSLARICQAVDYIDATASSHSRAFVIEVMGRHCGWLALMAGVATGADFILIPERPPLEGWEDEMSKVILKHRANGKRQTIVIVAEGATDINQKHISVDYVKDILAKGLGLDTRITTLGHLQRGGPPCAYDRMLATIQGYDAVEAVLNMDPKTPSPMIAITENKLTRHPLMEAVAATHEVVTALNAKDFDRAMHLRDSEFEEYFHAYQVTTKAGSMTEAILPTEKRLKIAIIHIGAPAGGMNAATRAAVTYCLSRGHKPYAIHNGFTGLTRHNSVRELDWITVEGWAIRGGSEIGTNRSLPSEDIGMVAWYFQKYAFDGLMIVGGFEAFHSLSILEKARPSYPAFRIPMVHIPATISNNVPGTEFSIGSDTCLNSLVDYCDAIKQSASASRRRVFIVCVQGGDCGYVATLAGLENGATAVYTPEEGMSLQMVDRDIQTLKKSFENDQGMNRAGKIIILNENSSKTFTAEFLEKAIREEARGRFDSRVANPGHVQQGGTPSAMDRVRAVRLAVRAIKFLEDHANSQERVLDDPSTAAVIGIRGASLVFTPVQKLVEEETEWSKRRPRNAFSLSHRKIADVLSGRT